MLETTTVEDAQETYAAIRFARPGGLDRAESQDVFTEPTMTLVEVMRLAAHRNAIASEYASGFECDVRNGCAGARTGAPRWPCVGRCGCGDVSDAARGDSGYAYRASQRCRPRLGRDGACPHVLAAGGDRTQSGRRAIDGLDRGLRDARNSGNPGTTADLTAAANFVVLLGGGFA